MRQAVVTSRGSPAVKDKRDQSSDSESTKVTKVTIWLKINGDPICVVALSPLGRQNLTIVIIVTLKISVLFTQYWYVEFLLK